jgi:hypothetical protein
MVPTLPRDSYVTLWFPLYSGTPMLPCSSHSEILTLRPGSGFTLRSSRYALALALQWGSHVARDLLLLWAAVSLYSRGTAKAICHGAKTSVVPCHSAYYSEIV